MFLWRCLCFLLPLVASVSTEIDDTKIEYYNRLARENLARKLETFKEMHDGRLPKNIILFIGDGMGTSIVSAARMYKSEKAGKPGQYSQMPFAMEGFDSTGWSKTSSWSAHVTDSAAGAIALLRGIKGESELTGVKPGAAPDCTDESAIVGENLAELALLKNLSVGSVTTVTLTHATPAALFAKSAHRGLQDDVPKLLKKYPTCRGHDLALQLLDFPANQFKVLMGGGEKHLYPEEDDGTRGDGKYVLDMWTQLPGTRKIVGSRDELMKVKANDSDLYLMGLFASEYMLPPLEATAEQKAETPSLAEMTEKAIEILSQNEKGYFLMVEGAQIDVRQHSNKLTLGADELLEFDDAIKRARKMTNREETLIIVTADHSHSLMVGEFEKKTDNMRTVGQEKKGIAFSHGTGKNRTEQDPLDLKYKFPAMIYFKRGTHGGDHVPIYSDGPYSWLFSSAIQNTEIGYLMKSLLCVTENYCLKKEGDLSPTYKKDEKPDETEDTTTTVCNVGWVSGVIIVGLSFIQLSSVDLVIREFSGPTLTGVYIRDVFRTEDNVVVIFFIKDFRNEMNIQLKTRGIYQSLRYSCYYPKCQGTFGQCTFQDFYGAVTIDSKELQNGTITAKISEQKIFLQYIDVRITTPPKHELGVVLQPAYYLADWQNLIQYFESWLAHGATIFYIYYHSWSRQIQAVIEFYKEKLGSGVVILPWSDFPARTGTNLSNDPNARSFNIVSEAALNNALYRARGIVKYLAMMDLDEIIWVSKRKPLIPFLQKMEKENPTTAQFSFPWIHFSAQLQLGQLVHPLEVSFDYLKKLQPIAKTSLDPIYFSTASRKVIHIVDKVELVDTHNVLKNYIDPDTGKNYRAVMLDSKVAACIHIRRIFNNVSTTEEETSSVLAGHATLLNRKYAKRIRNRLKMSPWFSEYRNTIRTLHACRKVTKLPNTTDEGVAQCRSLRACEGFLSGKENYHFAQMSWINLADPTYLP